MRVPFVTFRPLEREIDAELREAFQRVYDRSWYFAGSVLFCKCTRFMVCK